MLRIDQGDCEAIAFEAVLQSDDGYLSNFQLTGLLVHEPQFRRWVPDSYHATFNDHELLIPVVNIIQDGEVLGTYRVKLRVIDNNGLLMAEVISLEPLRTLFNLGDKYGHYDVGRRLATLPLVNRVDTEGKVSYQAVTMELSNNNPIQLEITKIEDVKVASTILAGLSGAVIEVYGLDDLQNPIYHIRAEGGSDGRMAGRFVLDLPEIPDEQWLLLKARGGMVLDRDEDGEQDRPCSFSGPVHALVKKQDLSRNMVNISLLSETAYQIAKPFLRDSIELQYQLGDIARDLLSNAHGNASGMDNAASASSDQAYERLLAFNPYNGVRIGGAFAQYVNLLPDVNSARRTLAEAVYSGDNTAILTALARDTLLSQSLMRLVRVVREDLPDKLQNVLSDPPDVSDLILISDLIAEIRSQALNRYGGTMPYGIHILQLQNILQDPVTGEQRLLSFHEGDGFGFQRYRVGETEVFSYVDLRNQAPVAQFRNIITWDNNKQGIKLVASDNDGDALSYFIISPPIKGVLLGEPPDFHYLADELGEDEFQFVAFDGQYYSNIGTVTLNVLERQNIAPSAVADAYSTFKNTDLNSTVSIFHNDDMGEAAAQFKSFGGGALGADVKDYGPGSQVNFAAGELTINNNGHISFVPVSGYIGEFNFFYRIANNSGHSIGEVIVQVQELPQADNDEVASNSEPGDSFHVPLNTDLNAKVAANDVLV